MIIENLTYANDLKNMPPNRWKMTTLFIERTINFGELPPACCNFLNEKHLRPIHFPIKMKGHEYGLYVGFTRRLFGTNFW